MAPSADQPVWANRVNRLKRQLAAGDSPLLMWITLAAPEIVEMLGPTDLDAVIIDLEHASYGLRETEELIRACDGLDLTALVRPPRADPDLVTRILDAGAYGIVFPMIESRLDAEDAVACMRYRPSGLRGWGGAHIRYARWQGEYAGAESRPGSGQPHTSIYSNDYVDKAQAELLTVLIVETAGGVEAIDEITHVEGVDAVLFGWGDHALESGFDWSRSHKAAERVYDACRQVGVGCALTPGGEIAAGFYPGCFYVVGIDSLLISSCLARAVEKARQAVDTAG